jgi:hypothetical protein
MFIIYHELGEDFKSVYGVWIIIIFGYLDWFRLIPIVGFGFPEKKFKRLHCSP